MPGRKKKVSHEKRQSIQRGTVKALRYDTNNSGYMSHHRPSPAFKEGKSYAGVVNRYPMGPEASPLTNDKRKRYGGSNAGGASVGGGT